jgi:hypothetical protein
MKKLVLFSLLLLSQLSFAAPKETDLRVEPWWPVYCEKNDYPYVNQRGPVEKLFEDESTVTFGFKTTAGSCEDHHFIAGTLSEQATVAADRDRLFEFKSPVKASVKLNSENEAYVTLTFDKKVIFKKRSTESFIMTFFPGGFHPPVLRTNAWGQTYWATPGDIQFMWNLYLVQISPYEAQLEVKLK